MFPPVLSCSFPCFWRPNTFKNIRAELEHQADVFALRHRNGMLTEQEEWQQMEILWRGRSEGRGLGRGNRGDGVVFFECGKRIWWWNIMDSIFNLFSNIHQIVYGGYSGILFWIYLKKNNSHIMFGNIHLLMGKNWYFRKRITLW